jgi:hypothetical protein
MKSLLFRRHLLTNYVTQGRYDVKFYSMLDSYLEPYCKEKRKAKGSLVID